MHCVGTTSVIGILWRGALTRPAAGVRLGPVQVFIDKPSVSVPRKGETSRRLLRFNVLLYDPEKPDECVFAPGAFIVEGLIHLPSYRLGSINVPSFFLGREIAGRLYDALLPLADQFPDFFPLQPRDLAVQALAPPAQTLIQKFPGYVKAIS